MKMEQLRSQFSVFIFFPSINESTDLKTHLSAMGYEAYFFDKQNSLLERIRESAPHILVLNPAGLESSLSEFVKELMAINPEIQIVCVGSVDQSPTLFEYRPYNFVEFVPYGAQLEIRCQWAIDRVCESLYLTYANEFLIGEKEKLETAAETSRKEISDLKIAAHRALDFSLQKKVDFYQRSQSKEDIFTQFFSSLEGRGKHLNKKISSIYFKYLPTVQSFVAVLASGMDVTAIKGAGAKLTLDETKNLNEIFARKEIPESLHPLLLQGVGLTSFVARPVMVDQELEGLFVFWSEHGLAFEDVENEFLVFELIYARAALSKKLAGFDTYDSVTGLLNRDQYFKKLDEELSRAKRLQKPVSLVRLSMDHFAELEQSLGRNNCEMILKSLAQMIKKTGRINDIAARTGDNEVTLILPHSARKGAALRAERLRRMIESHSFAMGGMRVTVSLGISEYPTLCQSSAELDQSSANALRYISLKGGNKVCMYKPTQTFKPDFEVPPS